MLTHDDIAAHFQHELGNVVQVARLADESLGLPHNGVDVFIPDCHIVRPEDAVLYPHSGFRQGDALKTFLRSLHRLQTAREQQGERVRVWHMGDLFDEWRSQQGGTTRQRIDGIRDAPAFREMFDLLLLPRPQGLGAEVMAGNHDFELFRLDNWRKARFRIVGDAGQMLVVHGDLFDAVEQLPDGLQRLVVQLARGFRPAEHHLFEEEERQIVATVNAGVSKTADVPIHPGATALAVAPEAQAGGPGYQAKNVIDGDRVPVKFFKHARELAAKLNAQIQGHVRVVVIGHTHIARIARGTQGDGTPFVLVDCGGWVDHCVLPGGHSAVLSAQVAVRIGNEFRILQVGATPAPAV